MLHHSLTNSRVQYGMTTIMAHPVRICQVHVIYGQCHYFKNRTIRCFKTCGIATRKLTNICKTLKMGSVETSQCHPYNAREFRLPGYGHFQRAGLKRLIERCQTVLTVCRAQHQLSSHYTKNRTKCRTSGKLFRFTGTEQ